MTSRARNYTRDEDAVIAKRMADNGSFEAIAEELGRPLTSVVNRYYLLRKSGVIPGYAPKRLSAAKKASPLEGLIPPLVLRNDRVLVGRTLTEGGFPRAVPTPVGTVWAAPDGRPWRHGRAVEGVAA